MLLTCNGVFPSDSGWGERRWCGVSHRNQSCALDAAVIVKPRTRPTGGNFGGDAVSLGLAELLPQYLGSVAGCLRLARGSGAPSSVSVWCRAVLASLVPPGSSTATDGPLSVGPRRPRGAGLPTSSSIPLQMGSWTPRRSKPRTPHFTSFP